MLVVAVMSEPVSESPYSLVTGKNTGKPVGPTIRAFLIFGDISGLPVKFPDKETGNLAKASRPAEAAYQGSFLDRSGKQLATDGARDRKGGSPGSWSLFRRGQAWPRSPD